MYTKIQFINSEDVVTVCKGVKAFYQNKSHANSSYGELAESDDPWEDDIYLDPDVYLDPFAKCSDLVLCDEEYSYPHPTTHFDDIDIPF